MTEDYRISGHACLEAHVNAQNMCLPIITLGTGGRIRI